MEKNNIDLSKVTSEEDGVFDIEFNLTKEKLSLAKWILLCLFCLTIMIIFIKVNAGAAKVDSVKDMFTVVFQSIVPMSSLVIGYYFGSKDDN
ncbi:hypothetical protein [Pectobacterium sp. CHL-2024]|uniref:hypothetical protein n=1 Tax=Pectobacterium sp. CHL-2024 TaxID=3377079 RepID=UPI00381BAB80